MLVMLYIKNKKQKTEANWNHILFDLIRRFVETATLTTIIPSGDEHSTTCCQKVM